MWQHIDRVNDLFAPVHSYMRERMRIDDSAPITPPWFHLSFFTRLASLYLDGIFNAEVVVSCVQSLAQVQGYTAGLRGTTVPTLFRNPESGIRRVMITRDLINYYKRILQVNTLTETETPSTASTFSPVPFSEPQSEEGDDIPDLVEDLDDDDASFFTPPPSYSPSLAHIIPVSDQELDDFFALADQDRRGIRGRHRFRDFYYQLATFMIDRDLPVHSALDQVDRMVEAQGYVRNPNLRTTRRIHKLERLAVNRDRHQLEEALRTYHARSTELRVERINSRTSNVEVETLTLASEEIRDLFRPVNTFIDEQRTAGNDFEVIRLAWFDASFFRRLASFVVQGDVIARNAVDFVDHLARIQGYHISFYTLDRDTTVQVVSHRSRESHAAEIAAALTGYYCIVTESDPRSFQTAIEDAIHETEAAAGTVTPSSSAYNYRSFAQWNVARFMDGGVNAAGIARTLEQMAFVMTDRRLPADPTFPRRLVTANMSGDRSAVTAVIEEYYRRLLTLVPEEVDVDVDDDNPTQTGTAAPLLHLTSLASTGSVLPLLFGSSSVSLPPTQRQIHPHLNQSQNERRRTRAAVAAAKPPPRGMFGGMRFAGPVTRSRGRAQTAAQTTTPTLSLPISTTTSEDGGYYDHSFLAPSTADIIMEEVGVD
jgi:hypothetical protein